MLARWDAQWPGWWVTTLHHDYLVVAGVVLLVDLARVPVDQAGMVLALLVREAARLQLRLWPSELVQMWLRRGLQFLRLRWPL